ncbi:MAG: hypothetical protein AAF191_10735 [Verrucomicrobiota bacterium]
MFALGVDQLEIELSDGLDAAFRPASSAFPYLRDPTLSLKLPVFRPLWMTVVTVLLVLMLLLGIPFWAIRRAKAIPRKAE